MNAQPKANPAYDISTGEFRVYVACLASYNNGHLYGQWMDVDSDLQDNIQTMLENSPIPNAEEWAIHDYELPFEISEYPDLDALIERVEAFESLEDSERDAYQAYLDAVDTDGTVQQFRDAYVGEYARELDFGYECADGLLDDVPEFLARHFDYESYTRELFDDGYTFHDGHVFSNQS